MREIIPNKEEFSKVYKMRPTTSIEELPDPIIEYILSYLSPYRDLKQCMQVNKAWYRYVYDVVRKTQRDFFNAVCDMSVRWCHVKVTSFPVDEVVCKTRSNLLNNVSDISHNWRDTEIPKRYSHSACCSANFMYIFGGCSTGTTFFNDLWRLNLGNRRWIRPRATGTNPPPKTCATLVSHCDNLVLFGGWTQSMPILRQQQVCTVFNEIHVYNSVNNRWTQITSETTCPPRAGHSATVHGDFMVVFGGIQKPVCDGPAESSNDVWTLDLKSFKWQKETIVTDSPPPRCGHSQIIIDENHLLIMGGCKGRNRVYTDIWLLRMIDGPGGMWEWEKMNVLSEENSAPLLIFHSACKVGSQVVVLGKTQKARIPPLSIPRLLRVRYRIWEPKRSIVISRMIRVKNAKRPSSEVEPSVDGRGGVLKRPADRQNNLKASRMSSSNEDEPQNASKKAPFYFVFNSLPFPSQNSALQQNTSHDSSPSTSGCHRNTASSSNSLTNSAMSNINLENRGNSDSAGPSHSNSSMQRFRSRYLDEMEKSISDYLSSHVVAARFPMCLHVLDISTAVQGTVTWRPPKNQPPSGPQEKILYSLVLGKGEIIMFGGIQKDLNSRQQEGKPIRKVASNSLHFITPEHHVI